MKKFKIKSVNELEIPEKELFKILRVFFINNKTWFIEKIMAITDAELLTIEDVTRIMKVSRTTLYRYEKSGKITPVEINGRTKRFLKSDIIAFAKGGCHVR